LTPEKGPALAAAAAGEDPAALSPATEQSSDQKIPLDLPSPGVPRTDLPGVEQYGQAEFEQRQDQSDFIEAVSDKSSPH
jgi:hypothetical protein